jgi:hypothetical protein
VLTWQNLLLTLWARGYLKFEDSDAFDARGRLVPIPKAEFEIFFKALFDHGKKASPPAIVTKAMKTNFLNWISHRSGRSYEDITDRLGSVFDDLFNRVDEELGGVRPGDIDPRFLQLFRVQ